MSYLVPPHGGKLLPLLVHDNELKDSIKEAETLPRVRLGSREISDLIMLAMGAFSPLAGFKGHSLLPLEDYPQKGVFGEAIDQRSQRGGNIDKDIYYYREGDLKIIYRADIDAWEMYDLKEDPGELNNIVNVSPEAEELKNKLLPRVRRWVS